MTEPAARRGRAAAAAAMGWQWGPAPAVVAPPSPLSSRMRTARVRSRWWVGGEAWVWTVCQDEPRLGGAFLVKDAI